MAGPAGEVSQRRVVQRQQQVESHQTTLEKPCGEGPEGVSWKTDKCLARAGHRSAGGWGALGETQAREAREKRNQVANGELREASENKSPKQGQWAIGALGRGQGSEPIPMSTSSEGLKNPKE